MKIDFIGCISPFNSEERKPSEEILNLISYKHIYLYQITDKEDLEIDGKYFYILTINLLPAGTEMDADIFKNHFQETGYLYDTVREVKLAAFKEMQSFITDDIFEAMGELAEIGRKIFSFVDTAHYANFKSYNLFDKEI